MQYKTITYKRIKNLENYNSEHLEVSAELKEDDDVIESTKSLRKLVNDILEKPVYPEIASGSEEYF